MKPNVQEMLTDDRISTEEELYEVIGFFIQARPASRRDCLGTPRIIYGPFGGRRRVCALARCRRALAWSRN
jgi:hypothetical protein